MGFWKAIVAGGTLALLALAGAAPARAADISGAGSSFIYPVFAKWGAAYQKATGIALNYQSIGSGGGIKQVTAQTVTFGATDKPLSDAYLARHGLVQFPMVQGGIVMMYNVRGVKPGQLVLDGKTIAAIYMGQITRWNAPEIAALNPGLKLPDQPIIVVYRSDGSGTTFNFTNYLVKVSAAWAGKIGSDTAVEWPVGLGAKGSEGVALTVKQTAGAIGYTEYAYVLQTGMGYSRMVNRDGKVVTPSLAAFTAAAANADWADTRNFHLIITDQPGAASWPIAASTWVIMPTDPHDAEAAEAALTFFDWAYANGGAQAKALGYVAVPENVVALIKASWTAIRHDGEAVYTTK